jgi:HEAT repeat protein
MQLDRARLQRELTALVRQTDGFWRGDAARFLGQCAGSSALRLLELLVRDPDESLRSGAADGIGFVAEERAAQILLRLVGDTHDDVRFAAIAALGRRKYAPAIPVIVQCLRPIEPEHVRIQAARSLGNIGDLSAVEPLIRALEYRGTATLWAAAALGALRDERAIVPLSTFFRRIETNKDWVLSAIAGIGGSPAARWLSTLFPLEDATIRAHAAADLARTDSPEAVIGLLKGVADEERMVKINAWDGLCQLSRRVLEEGLRLALIDPDPLVRGEAARLAPYYADETMERTLAKIASWDGDARVRILAADAGEACRNKRRICGFGPEG